MVLALVGGYTALLWIIIKFFFDDYENFKLINSMIGRVYACTP